MDINELIDNLRFPSWHDLEDPDATLLGDAADALSTLQAENEKLKNAADSWKKKWAGLDKAVRNGSVYRPMQEELNFTHEENQSLKDENEKLRAELKSKVDLVFQQTKELDRRNLLLREQEAELEQAKRELDAAVRRIREWEKLDTYLLIHNVMTPEKWRGQKED